MKVRNLIIAILTLLMMGVADNVEAQSKNKYKRRRQTNKKISHYKGGQRGYGRFHPYMFVGAQLNAGNYFGDLAPVNKAASTDISFTRPGFGFEGGYKFHHSAAIRVGLNWVRVSGDDFSADPTSENSIPRYIRNLSFRNDIKELQIGVEVSLIPNYGSIDQRLPLNAYLFLGGAVYLHEPMAKMPELDYQVDVNGGTDYSTASFGAAPNAGEWVKLRPLQTEGQSYSNVEFSIPIAVGATMRLPGTNLNASLEFGFRYLFTDYIDDVSTTYVGLDQFTDPVARILSDRSVEATSFQGEARDLSNLNPGVLGGFFHDVNNGAGVSGATRGNPDNNDMIFITQLKVRYFVTSAPKRSAKFR